VPTFQEPGFAKQRIPVGPDELDQSPGFFLADTSLPASRSANIFRWSSASSPLSTVGRIGSSKTKGTAEPEFLLQSFSSG